MRIPLRLQPFSGLILCLFLLAGSTGAGASEGFENDRCLGCHLAKSARSHPVGIAPPVADDRLLLTADGNIGCVTCHFAHDTLPTGLAVRTLKPRVSCSLCHGQSLGHRSQGYLAHQLVDTAQGGAALKPQTRACIACHDGSSGPDTHVNDGPGMFAQASMVFTSNGDAPLIGRSHPILVDYARTAQERDRDYRSPEEMSPLVQFENGELGCLSCHDLFNRTQPDRLVQSNTRSALCLQCHQMSPTTNDAGASTELARLAGAGILRPYRADPVYVAR